MKATELRIGNLVQHPNGVDIITDFISELSRFKGGKELECWSVEVLKPIPLTEEWLLKFGFVKNINYKIILNEFYHLELMKIGNEYAVFHEKRPEEEYAHSLMRISFVHELQNLYFALMGKELTLNL